MSFHRNPWLVAEERYLDGLCDEERAIYKSASAENLLYSTSAAQIRHEQNSISRAASKKLQPLIAAVTQYGSALDVLSNTAPLFFSPIWGSLRVLLHIASEFEKYYLRLIDMLERIGDVIPRFKSYERLFSKHEQLLYSLSAVYLDIIVFCADAKSLFQKAKKKKKRFFIQLPGSGLRAMKLAWKPFDQSFGDILDKFRRHTEKVEMEAQLSHMIEQAIERKEQGNEREAQALERAIAETERQRQLLLHNEQLRDKLFLRLSQYDQDYKHRIIKKVRVQGTGQWMLNSIEFNTWLGEAVSSCLWCYGIPGSGKSIVTTVIVDTIRDDHLLDGSSLAWFYCDYSEPRTLEPLEIVGSLIKQLLPVRLLSMSLDLQLQLEKIYENGRIPDTDELFDMFLRVIKKLPKVYIVIDGLDECKEVERGFFLSWLKALSTSSASTVKLFVTSRNEIDIKKAFGNAHSIQTTGQNVSSDISAVVENLVRTRVAGERDWSQDPVLVQEIVDALIAGARGMFLWVTLQLDDICEELSEAGVRDVLKRLPNGLNETFARALQKIHMRGPTQVAAAQRLFMWLVSAKRTLTLEELQEAVSIQPGDIDLVKGKIPDAQQLIRVCGSLVVYDPQEKTIKLAHYTIQQFLLSHPSEFEISLQLPDFHFELSDADIDAGQICMTYLCFSGFETQIVPRTLVGLSAQEAMLLESQTTGWVPQMAGLSQTQTAMWNLFRGKVLSPTGSAPDIDFSKYLYHVQKPAKDLMHEYKLLDYVTEFWVKHAASFTEENPEVWRQFKNVALERKRPFEFQPWLKGNATGSTRIMHMFRWALEKNHSPLIRLALDSNTDNEPLLSSSLGNDEHALCFASRMGHQQTLDIILPLFDSSFEDNQKFSEDVVIKSIVLATSNGHPDIAANLLWGFLGLGALATDKRIDEVFKMALDNDYEELSNLLINHLGFIDVTRYAELDGTPLLSLERPPKPLSPELSSEVLQLLRSPSGWESRPSGDLGLGLYCLWLTDVSLNSVDFDPYGTPISIDNSWRGSGFFPAELDITYRRPPRPVAPRPVPAPLGLSNAMEPPLLEAILSFSRESIKEQRVYRYSPTYECYLPYELLRETTSYSFPPTFALSSDSSEEPQSLEEQLHQAASYAPSIYSYSTLQDPEVLASLLLPLTPDDFIPPAFDLPFDCLQQEGVLLPEATSRLFLHYSTSIRYANGYPERLDVQLLLAANYSAIGLT